MSDQRSILIVDDKEAQREATKALFVVEGYTVQTAQNPEDAMEILRSDADFSLALFDIKLGTEAKGLKLVHDARMQRPTLRIIVYTGGDPELGGRALQKGATFFIQKTRPETLVRIAHSVAEMWELERKLQTHRMKSDEMQRIFDAVGIELLVRDLEGRIILANQTKRKAWKKRHPGSVKHDCIGEFRSPDDAQDTGVSALPAQRASSDFFKTREQVTAGRTLLIETRPLLADDGQPIGSIEAAIDISRRHQILEFEHEIEVLFATASKEEIGQKIVDQIHEFTSGHVRLYLNSASGMTGFCSAGMELGIQFKGHELMHRDAQAESAFAKLYPSTLQWEGKNSEPCEPKLKTDGATEKLFLPLMRSKERIGMIVVDNKPCPDRKFTREDLDLLALFRPCIEEALTNADRRDQAMRGEMWLKAIAEMDQHLLSTNDFEKIQEKVMKSIVSMLEADAASLVIVNGKNHLREIVRQHGDGLDRMGGELSAVPNGPIEWVLDTKGTLSVERDLWSDERFKALLQSRPAKLPNPDRFQAALLCPLLIRENLWAVAVFWFCEPLSLSERGQSYLSIMLQRISLAKARINDYSEMQRAAMEAAKESSVGLLASAYNHNFRNSIQGLLTKARLLERKVNQENRADTSEMVADVLAISKRIESLRSWITPDRNQSPNMDLVATLREVEELVSDAAGPAGVSIRLNLPPSPVWVDAGGGALKIAILDIFQNAVKFTSEKGLIQGSLTIEEGTAVLTIRDTGPGMPQEVLSAINEPGAVPPESPKPPPFGIGLYLALKAVARVHGTIRASNPETGGAEFEIRMPIINQGGQP